jgi:hypothetical protein
VGRALWTSPASMVRLVAGGGGGNLVRVPFGLVVPRRWWARVVWLQGSRSSEGGQPGRVGCRGHTFVTPDVGVT